MMPTTRFDLLLDALARALGFCRCCIAWPLARISDILLTAAFIIGGKRFVAGECADAEHDHPER